MKMGCQNHNRSSRENEKKKKNEEALGNQESTLRCLLEKKLQCYEKLGLLNIKIQEQLMLLASCQRHLVPCIT